MDLLIASVLDFGNPFPDKYTVWIKSLSLFDGVIHANGVDARRSRLHLKLTQMDSRFVVCKHLREMGMDLLQSSQR